MSFRHTYSNDSVLTIMLVHIRGVVLSPAVIPIALTVTWSKLTRAGVFCGCIGGAVLGMLAWMFGCWIIFGASYSFSLSTSRMLTFNGLNRGVRRGDQRPEPRTAILGSLQRPDRPTVLRPHHRLCVSCSCVSCRKCLYVSDVGLARSQVQPNMTSPAPAPSQYTTMRLLPPASI